MSIEIQATNVFYKNDRCKAPIIINRGGARSTKSYSISQLLSTRLVNCKKRKILVLRKTLPSLKLSVYKDFKGIWSDWGIINRIKEEKQTLDYYYGDNWLHFGGLDDPEKIKSTDWNDIMMEEMTDFNLDDFKQLRLRTSARVAKGDPPNQIFGCLNPIDEHHWIKEHVIDKIPGVVDIHSSYKDNPFLSQAYVDMIESLEEQDPNQWRIYGLGEWGSLENIIYSNWETVDAIPEEGVDEVFYGLDFGFNAPSGLIKVTMVDEEPFEEELIYESGLTNTDLIGRLKTLKINPNDPIYCDNAEPDRIEEILRAGFNAIPADKAKIAGIDFVKSLFTRILKSSAQLIKEVRGYSWRQDKNGRVLDEPVKFNDHLMDARRYAYYTHLGKRQEFSIRWLQ